MVVPFCLIATGDKDPEKNLGTGQQKDYSNTTIGEHSIILHPGKVLKKGDYAGEKGSIFTIPDNAEVILTTEAGVKTL